MKSTIVLVFTSLFSAIAVAQVTYLNVADSLDIQHTYGMGEAGGGVSFYDFDKDGWDDLSFATQDGDSLLIYKNISGEFQRVSFSGVDHTAQAKHILWVDFDNDGDADLYVTSLFAPNVLYENDGNFHFTNITEAAGLPTDTSSSFGAAWADYDRDGWLDLYVTYRELVPDPAVHNRLFRNQADGTFEETTFLANAADAGKLPFCASFLDYDNDGWDDIHIVHDFDIPSVLLRNKGNGQFEDVSAITGADVEVAGMGIAIGDYDQNGYQDIYVSNTPVGNKLLKNSGLGYFDEVAEEAGVIYNDLSWSVNFLDADNDGLPDLYVSGGVPGPPENSSAFFLNNGNGTFSKSMDSGFAGDDAESYSNAVGDFNNDGYPDIAVNNAAPHLSHLWKNSGGTNHWLKLGLEGVTSNRDGIGARIEYYLGNEKYLLSTHCGIGFLSQNSGYHILGLDENEVVDRLKITWPSGVVDELENVPAGQFLQIREGDFTTSANDLPAISNDWLRTYPNPANQEVTIENTSSQPIRKVRVFDNSARPVISLDNIETTHFPLQTRHLTPGIYLISLEFSSGEKMIRQIVIL